MGPLLYELNAHEINNRKQRMEGEGEGGEETENGHRETRSFFVRDESPGRATTPSFVLDVAAFVP